MARGMLMGALSGLGKGMVANAQRWTAEDMKAAEQQAELEKEQRIFERQKELKAIDNTYEIDREKRGIENDKTRAQNAIDIKSDPANVEKLSNAEIGMLRAKDQYKDSRFDTELDQAGRMARATHIDNTDYEGRNLSHELAKLQLEEAKKGGKLSDSEKETIRTYREKAENLDKDITRLRTELADSTLDEGVKRSKETELEVAIAARNQAYSNALAISNKGSKSTGPSRDVIEGDAKGTESEAEKRFAAFNRFKQSGAYKAYLEGGGKDIKNVAELTTEEMNALSDDILGKGNEANDTVDKKSSKSKEITEEDIQKFMTPEGVMANRDKYSKEDFFKIMDIIEKRKKEKSQMEGLLKQSPKLVGGFNFMQ